MDAMTAAERLYALIDAPRGALNVIALPDSASGFILKVWVSQGSCHGKIPSSFEGYKVQVEQRPRFNGSNAF